MMTFMSTVRVVHKLLATAVHAFFDYFDLEKNIKL